MTPACFYKLGTKPYSNKKRQIYCSLIMIKITSPCYHWQQPGLPEEDVSDPDLMFEALDKHITLEFATPL